MYYGEMFWLSQKNYVKWVSNLIKCEHINEHYLTTLEMYFRNCSTHVITWYFWLSDDTYFSI